ncbi:GspH/FimT family pseudopilin [Thiocapsa rosea]|uniref:Type II secretion system protein H n=1 Tax=Thiocapsa rosea TaxID=69360 RepID=A0A495VEB7_9GAMM|nr:GspH/FimT family pseudopilin [Thiocapsa rosea]RKT46775.1 type IV fimbrial biogenesis protein FimT [Thiocapsa rosea]
MNKRLHRHRKADGFSLIELLFSISILAILLGLGIPSFQGLIERNRVTSATNELITTLQLARSTAIRRNEVVSICPLVDANTCGGSWSSGWMVFIGEASVTEPSNASIIRQNSALAPSVTLTSNLDAGAAISYGNAGQIVSGGSVDFTFSGDSEFRCLTVPLSGKTSFSYELCQP